MTWNKKVTCGVLAGFVPMLLYAFASGPDARVTGAPGDNPQACTACHFGTPINSAGGSVTASFSSGSTYVPGQAVDITVTVSDPRNSIHGFQMTSRLESNLATAQAGRFSFASNAGVFVLCDNNVPRTPNGNCPASSPVEFIEHSAPRSGTWTFTWMPPATAQGPVHFYIAGNAVNNNGQPDGGDHVYTASYVLTPQTPSCGQAIPTIATVRRIEGWGDGTTFSSGSWLEIQGSNLAGNTRPWGDSDFTGNPPINAPTSLDGTSVRINGKSGFIAFISPTQINLQAPDDPATGPVGVTVTNCGETSNLFTATTLQKTAVAPGILAPPSNITPFFVLGGTQYAEATVGFSDLFVGNLSSPLMSRPAKPGDSILLYAIGLGDTTPVNRPGVKATGQEVVNAQVLVNFETTSATVSRAALYPTFIGLYYIIVTVPNVPDGDYQIKVTIDGQPLQQQPFFLTVHN
jgi:uncharacterized protein (TIGR03437 family)